jgi:hypothetical protein
MGHSANYPKLATPANLFFFFKRRFILFPAVDYLCRLSEQPQTRGRMELEMGQSSQQWCCYNATQTAAHQTASVVVFVV